MKKNLLFAGDPQSNKFNILDFVPDHDHVQQLMEKRKQPKLIENLNGSQEQTKPEDDTDLIRLSDDEKVQEEIDTATKEREKRLEQERKNKELEVKIHKA